MEEEEKESASRYPRLLKNYMEGDGTPKMLRRYRRKKR